MAIRIEDLAEIIGAYPVTKEKTDLDSPVERVFTQSVYARKNTAVIAARWYDVDSTVKEALERGACAVFTTEKDAVRYNDPRVMAVRDPLDSVERFEKWCEKDCYAKRITITGSVGKTTTTGLINTVISDYYNTLTRHSASNSHGAILRGFQDLKPEHEYWVQEVGGVQPHYIESSAYMMHSDAVVLTNIGVSHLDKYVTKEEIFRDKSSLERYAKLNAVVIINKDDPILKSADYCHRVITFAVKDKTADYFCENVTTTDKGLELDVICGVGEIFHVKTNLFGDYNAYNVLAAVAVGKWAGIPTDNIIQSIGKYRPSGMRQNMLNIGGYRILVDCFNAEPKTVLGSAQTLSQINLKNEGRKIFITGHIDKLGENSAKMHAELGHQLSGLDVDIMCFYAGDSRYTYEAVKEDGFENALYFDDRDELDDWIRNNVKSNDVTFYKSGQFEAALAKTIDHVYGTKMQNEQQFNEGKIYEQGDYQVKLRQDDIAELHKYSGKRKHEKLPAEYEGKKIIRISGGAFNHNHDIEEVDIPDNVVNIGQEAFYACDNLKKVTLPKNLKIIERSAFNYCRCLQRLELPKGTIHIDYRAFRDCIQLEEIIIPDTVGYIGEEAFKGCDNLTIVCPKGSYAEKYALDHDINFRIQ